MWSTYCFFSVLIAPSSVVDETICSQHIFINKIYYLPFLHKNHLPFLIDRSIQSRDIYMTLHVDSYCITCFFIAIHSR